MNKDQWGVWEILLPRNPDGTLPIAHGSRVKVSMICPDGRRIERIPAWIKRAEQKHSNDLYEGKSNERE